MATLPSSEKETSSKSSPRGMYAMVGFGIGLVVLIGVILLARSDKGVIDVSATIQNSNNTATENQEDGGPTPVPVVNTHSDLPNGGLVPQGSTGNEAPPAPEPQPVESAPEASTTATTTESANSDTASSETAAEETPAE